MDCGPCSTGTVATVKACSQSSADSGSTPVEHPSSLEQSPQSKKRPRVTPPSNGAAVKRGKKEQGTKTAPIDTDATALDDVDQQPNKAEGGMVLPTARSLKLRILPDQYVAGACFYYAVAQSLHAISSNAPLDSASLRAKAIAVFREMCGLSIQESALSVNRDLGKDTWQGRPQGGMPEHFASLAKHLHGSMVLLRSNRFSLVTSGFGMDSALTSATVWVPGRDVPLHFRDCGDMEEQCHRPTVVVIAEAERDGVKGGGHFRGAVFDHSLQAHAVTDVLLAGIKEGQATIDPRGVLECAVLLDHGRFLGLPVNERAAYGVDQLRQFMAAHQEELRAAHVNCDRALVEWEGLKEHMVQHFATVQMSKMWEALAPERAHAQWVNVWRVLALLRTYCPSEVAVERAISLRGRFCRNMHDIVETHVLSMCMALHSNLPPLQQRAKGQGIAVARHPAARARFDLRPRQRVSRKVSERESLEAAMLQCLQSNEATADDGDNLPFFGGPGTPLASTAPSGKGTERHQADVVRPVAPDGTPDSHACNHDFITFRRGMECATCKKEVRILCNTCLV